MPREFFDHTGDVGVRLSGATLADLFREAARSFTETLTDLDAVRAVVEEHVEVDAPSPDDLLIAWIDELLYRFEVRNMLVRDVEIAVEESGGAFRLVGVLHGEPGDAARHPIKVLVKGATYHQLHVRREDGKWRTDLVFDI